MAGIDDASDKVPMMYRAQVGGRCQPQFLPSKKEGLEPDALFWVDEWVDKAYPDAPKFGNEVQTRTYTLSWRFITNSGQDDGVIRPVIGAKGWPFYPGSSMKGLFRKACEQAERTGHIQVGMCQRYCGSESDLSPGILRFHGGYPTDTHWTENLLDVVHPQQGFQVKSGDRDSGALVQISLYKPELKFGISSTETLSETEWQEIWKLWEQALSMGIGSRVSAGYGQPEVHTGKILYQTRLKGRGQAAKLIDGTGEFRPNIFRAAIRGHALRIFGGLTDANTAERLVEELFGGISRRQATVGLLGMAFRDTRLEIGEFGRGSYAQPTYKVEGDLLWMLMRSHIASNEENVLKDLIKALTRFGTVLGGFGKSWRRADHRLVYPDYYEESNKPLIGCHWEWLGKAAQLNDVRVRKLEKVGEFIDQVREVAQAWMVLQGITPNPEQHADWREAWHPSTVQVWGRANEDGIEDCEAVYWFHGPYQEAIRSAGIREGSIYRSSVTGQLGQIGRMWHRMYPFVRLVKDPANPNKPMPRATQQYFELLTIFPDSSTESREFLQFLKTQQKTFQKLWPL